MSSFHFKFAAPIVWLCLLSSVCPTIDFQCEPPFYSVHFSYEITFQKVK